MTEPGYFLDSRSRPGLFKPYDWREVRRDLHDARTASLKLGGKLRRLRKARAERVRDVLLARARAAARPP